ncbi:uncharacterized protein BROUX77_006548 [Berkeleyomyces rouxiae]|uniref:uncharacterized protein n=1 Tax=Berkeleyomyces rouxiae TaxID=2035830 RepID=UPI003B79A07A
MSNADASNDVNESDSTSPLTGVTICCTSLPVCERETIALAVKQLGGEHIYDLTPDVTHLLVGKYDTPKYRHVARARPDVKAMDPAWINAVRDAWRADQFDFPTLEKQYQLLPLETNGVTINTDDGQPIVTERGQLRVCLTGIEDSQERVRLRKLIENNGGIYTGELTKAATHLIVSKPTGRKYDAAISWGLYTVSVSWLIQSIERGMILEESCFSPLLPPEKQGVGAYVPRENVKRKRPTVDSQGTETKLRKLRKTASMKLGSQHASVWNSILGGIKPADSTNSAASKPSDGFTEEPEPRAVHTAAIPTPIVPVAPQPTVLSDGTSIFSGCNFYIHGFEQKKLRVARQAVSSRGGTICSSSDEAQALPCSNKRFILVPQNMQWSKIQNLDDGAMATIHIVTEFFVEKCLFHKTLLDPTQNVVGRPFKTFPIPDFLGLRIHMSGFTGIDLHHISKTVEQLGGKVSEFFNTQCSLLVLRSLQGARKEKLESAIVNRIPIVSAEWLWACVSSGTKASLTEFKFHELEQRAGSLQPRKSHDSLHRSRSETTTSSAEFGKRISSKSREADASKASNHKPSFKALPSRSFDASAFIHDDKLTPGLVLKKSNSESAQSLSNIGIKPTTVSKDTAKATVSFLQAALDNEAEEEENDAGFGIEQHSVQDQNPLDNQPEAQTEFLKASSNSLPQLENHNSASEPKATTGISASNAMPKDSLPVKSATTKASIAPENSTDQERKALSAQLLNLLDNHIAISNESSTATRESSSSVPKKRDRRVFGRNLSTTSLASIGSVNSNHESEAEKNTGKFETISEREELDRPPPATQVEYRDPEAAKVRAALLDKMSGRTVSEPVRGRGKLKR